MSALSGRITEVQAAHRWATIPTGAWAAGRYICAGCEAISKTLSEHEAHVAERIEAELPPALSPSLLEQLQPEGSAVLIQKANSDNLNWTWRVRYQNGATGREDTRTGASLSDLLSDWSVPEERP